MLARVASDDEPIQDVPTRSASGRDVGLHIREALESASPGAELTVAQIAALATSHYASGEISPGAVTARLHSSTGVPGVERVPDSRPLRARRAD